MAYNNGYPATYQPMFYQPQFPSYQQGTQAQQQTSNSNLIWVQGEAGAKSYLVAPNTTVQLWDSEKQTIYLKSADASGMPSMKTLDYTIRETPQAAPSPAVVNTPDYVTKAEFEQMSGQIAALRAELDDMNAKKQNNRRRLTEDE